MSEKMHVFKVGDRVKVKDSVDHRIRAFGETGTIVTVEEADGGYQVFRVNYDHPLGVRHIQFFENEIELVAPVAMQSCPFCGKEDWRIESTNDEHTVWCGNCGAIGPNELTRDRAVELWNLRRPQARLEKLVAKIALLCAKSMDATATLNAIIEEIADYSSKENPDA